MTWICPWCGTENELEEKIGRNEPKCRKCKEERISAEQLEDMKAKCVRNLQEEKSGIFDRICAKRSDVDSLKSEIASKQIEINDLSRDYDRLEWEIRTWTSQPTYTSAVRHIAKDQKMLPFEVPV